MSLLPEPGLTAGNLNPEEVSAAVRVANDRESKENLLLISAATEH